MKEAEKKRIARELKISRPDWYRKKQAEHSQRMATFKLILSTAKHIIALIVILGLLIIFVCGVFWSISLLT